MGKYNKEYLYKVGQVVNGLEILEQTRHGKQNTKAYKCRCIKCGFGGGESYYKQNGEYIKDGVYIIREGDLKQGQSCSCCSSKATVPNINSIWAKRKDLIPYFINEEDSKKYTQSSGKKIELKCPICGTKKIMKIDNLNNQGFSCPNCSDGVSYPEKIVSNVLQQLGIKYIKEYSPYWCKNKTLNDNSTRRYDFYFNYDGTRYIIEAHGKQHYEDGFKGGINRTLEQEQANDLLKKKIALNRGNIKEQNYITLDCRESNIDFIRNNIINSRLNEVFDLSIIDWNKIAKESEKNLVKEVCNYWNENYENVTTVDIVNIFNIDKTTVQKYLKRGTDLGWLDTPYDGKVESARAIKLKKSGFNCYQAQQTYIYSLDKILLYTGTQKDCGQWLFDNNYVGSVESGRKAIKRNKDTDKPYKPRLKRYSQTPIYFYTYELEQNL